MEEDFQSLKEKIATLSDGFLWKLYAYSSRQLKERNLVRTRNITGERGEFIAREFYNRTPGLPILQIAPEGTRNIDAISRNGERYTIKTISGRTVNTGIFSGITQNDDGTYDKKFEFLIIVVLNQDLEANMILELNWDQFLKFKYLNLGMKGYGVTVNNKLLAEAKIIYKKSTEERGRFWRQELYTDQ